MTKIPETPTPTPISDRSQALVPAGMQPSHPAREHRLFVATATLKRRVLQARVDAVAFIEIVMRTAKGGPVRLAYFHSEWLDRMQFARRVQIQAAKSHAKCLTGNQRVHLADGRLVPARELIHFKQFLVTTYNEGSDTWGAQRARIADNGFKPYITLKLVSGRIIERTEEEPLLTPLGFVPISRLAEGDYIASARILPEPFTTEPLNANEARLMGYMAGVHVPEIIHRASNEIVKAYISAYWNCNGTAQEEAKCLIMMDTSQPLLESVQTLLLRFGISSCLSRQEVRHTIYWRLAITGISAARMVKLVLGTITTESGKLCLHPFLKNIQNDGQDVIPIGWLGTYAEHDANVKDVLAQLKIDTHPTSVVSREHAVRLYDALSVAGAEKEAIALGAAIRTNIRWERIVAVNKGHSAQTFAISVERNPVYLCENTIAHNTTTLLGYLAFLIGTNSNIRIKLFAQSDEKARERISVIANMIQRNKIYQYVFPRTKPCEGGPWHKYAITVQRDVESKDPTLQAAGITSSVEGGRADILAFDDISDHRNALLFPQVRENIKKKVFAEILPMLEADGRAISIATPHHKLDVVSALARNPKWENHVYPVGMGEDPFVPLWPEVWPREALMALYEEIGPLEFNRAYRCQSYTADMQIMRPELIRYYDAELLGNPWSLVCVQAYDPAITKTRKSSYFASVTVLYDPDRNMVFIADAWHDKLGFREQAARIIAQAKNWQPSRIVIEETGYQAALREMLHELADEPLPIYPVSPGGKSKELRFSEIVPMFEAGRVYFNPRLDPHANLDLHLTGDLVTQVLEFFTIKDRDLGDALVYAILALRGMRTEESEDDWNDDFGIATRLSVIG